MNTSDQQLRASPFPQLTIAGRFRYTLLAMALAFVLAKMLLATPAEAVDLQGRVVGVTDGDTLRLLVGGRREYKIRLGEVDAPESGQPFGRTSKRMLSDLVFGATVSARVADVDRYGRSVAVVTRGHTNINAEMVRRGGAWAYRRYLSDQRYLLWERQARQARRGLWGLQPDQIVTPWDWRSARRGKVLRTTSVMVPHSPRAVSKAAAAPSAQACGIRWKCGQMNSCADAVYHLKVCGLARLDGDSDGVPCETPCR